MAGGSCTEPSAAEKRLPWQSQVMTESFTPETRQPAWVQTALNALNSPFSGWVTTTLSSAKTLPPPTGISPAGPSSFPPDGSSPPPGSPPPQAASAPASPAPETAATKHRRVAPPPDPLVVSMTLRRLGPAAGPAPAERPLSRTRAPARGNSAVRRPVRRDG